MTIIERAIELVADNSRIGLGSGHAVQAFAKVLGEYIRSAHLRVHGVPTSEETARLSRREGIPLLTLAEATGHPLVGRARCQQPPRMQPCPSI